MSEVLSVKEAAQELGISQITLYGFINDGTLIAHKYNQRVIRIDRTDLEDFRRQHRTGASELEKMR